MAEATIMVLKDVDLGCKRCHKKIKKLLNKIPDWTFFEKENAVMIKVVSSSPENIKKQLLSEGGETIKKIEVLEKKPKPPADKPKGAEEKPPTPVRGCPPFYPTGCHPLVAGLLGVAVTEAVVVAAVKSLMKKIPHAPSCESYSINAIVLVWFLNSFSQLGVESVLSGRFFSLPRH
ncbi:hypothetical protein CK203_042231 [Vitis vinifera]|uniref:HMA domain-containing protein n=1 Tax=Vitis vinifera TaxID=29760 RepID=A0A438H7P6_VITVI|nr:hypothetical protein CK203_042231 [Vitis vinifera]